MHAPRRLAETLEFVCAAGTRSMGDVVDLGESIAEEAISLARAFYGTNTAHPVMALCLTVQVRVRAGI